MKNADRKILIFGGTTEGHRLAEYLDTKKADAYVSVATEYGSSVLPSMEYCKVLQGRMDTEQIRDFILAEKITMVLDATHPYAVEVSDNIQKAIAQVGELTNREIEYLRIVRENCPRVEGAVYLDNMEELITYFNQHDGKALVTTGSKELARLKEVENYEKRFYVRVLPVEKVVKECMKNGFLREHIIEGRGPFSTEENVSLIKKLDVKYVVTKDTGIEGGFMEKAEAAKITGVQLVVLSRPRRENGVSLQAFLKKLEQ